MWQNCVLTLSLTLPYLRISINHIHERRQSQISLDRREDGQNRQHMLPAFVEFHFWFAKISDLSLTECVSPHHYLFNILKVTASWTKDRITSDSLMATLHTASSLLTAATRRTGRHCASRERSGSPGSGERVSWLEWGLRIRTPPDAHNLTPALRSQDTGRPRVQQCTAWYTTLLIHIDAGQKHGNILFAFLSSPSHLLYSGKAFQKNWFSASKLKCWQKEKLLEYVTWNMHDIQRMSSD